MSKVWDLTCCSPVFCASVQPMGVGSASTRLWSLTGFPHRMYSWAEALLQGLGHLCSNRWVGFYFSRCFTIDARFNFPSTLCSWQEHVAGIATWRTCVAWVICKWDLFCIPGQVVPCAALYTGVKTALEMVRTQAVCFSPLLSSCIFKLLWQ